MTCKHMSRFALNMAALASAALFASASTAAAENVSARLSGFQEVPALVTAGKGTLQATINVGSIAYTLTYDTLESAVNQAHIHIAQSGVNGGIMVFLCTNLGNGPAGTPACPGTTAGSVSGTINSARVVGPAGQNIDPGQLNKVVRAIRAGVAYANVHTTGFAAGEIRGQIKIDE